MRVSNSHSTLQSGVPLDVPLDIFVEWAPPAVAPTRHATRHIYVKHAFRRADERTKEPSPHLVSFC